MLTLGIPLLFCYWYPALKRELYYDFCTLREATHFYIVNYDDVVTIVEKQEGVIYISNT